MSAGAGLAVLGNMDVDTFFADYWQQKPLLLPGALTELPALSPDELAGLALEEDIESRLVIAHGNGSDWTLEHGPFADSRFADLPDSHWSLLVQAVDHWVPEVQALHAYFRFLPRWRVDDIMVSYAVDGGGVGPHFDSYDVFLLQGRGHRRWQLGQQCSAATPLVNSAPLPLLREFTPEEEYLLGPGDILYVPPGLAHWGIAEGESMTYSIGFRGPSLVEMFDDLATDLISRRDDFDDAYRDPPMRAALATGVIDKAFINGIKARLTDFLDDDHLLASWFARYMTRTKYSQSLATEEGLSVTLAHVLASGSPLRVHPASRCAAIEPQAYTAKVSATTSENAWLVAVDGETYVTTPRLAGVLSARQDLTADLLATFSEAESMLVNALLEQGSLEVVDDSP